jgi:hypothetical protein
MITKKIEKAIKDYQRNTPESDRAYGTVIGKAVMQASIYRLLPLLGYIIQGKLFIQGILLKSYVDEHSGSMDWAIPLNERTMGDALTVLASLGWDGRVWPRDKGWPDGDPKEAKGLRVLMERIGLTASLVFPPHNEKGSRVLRIHVLKTGGTPFPLPPYVDDADKVAPTQAMIDRLASELASPTPLAESSQRVLDQVTSDLVRQSRPSAPSDGDSDASTASPPPAEQETPR